MFAKILRGNSDKAVFTGADSRPAADNTGLRILSDINDNYRTVTLEDVASRFSCSVPHCSKLIRDETGIGFIAPETAEAIQMINSNNLQHFVARGCVLCYVEK